LGDWRLTVRTIAKNSPIIESHRFAAGKSGRRRGRPQGWRGRLQLLMLPAQFGEAVKTNLAVRANSFRQPNSLYNIYEGIK
jgi:hypothetical protein